MRDRHFMLTNRGELRQVVEIWQEPSKTPLSSDTPEERAAQARLQRVFEHLRK